MNRIEVLASSLLLVLFAISSCSTRTISLVDEEMLPDGPEQDPDPDVAGSQIDDEIARAEEQPYGNGNANEFTISDLSDQLADEPNVLDSHNIENAKLAYTANEMDTAAGHHHHHHHYVHGWLDMGAHTGKKGSFGWHDKHPVGGKGRR